MKTIARASSAFLPLVAALGFAQVASASDGLSGLLEGNFAYGRSPGLAGKSKIRPTLDSDQYSVHGVALYTLDNPGFGVQLEGGNDFYFAVPHSDAHLWWGGGSIFWRDNKGTIGLSGSYSSVDAPALPLFSGKTPVESYGIFGEYYVFRDLTLQIKGGGTTGVLGKASLFSGGGLTWYDSPDLAVHTEINFTSYSSGADWTDINGNVEYLPFASFPLSLYLGYDFVNYSGSGYLNTSTFFAGLKFRFGEGGSLIEYQRTGPIEWTGNSMPGANIKY